MPKKLIFLLFILSTLHFTDNGWACTTFVIKNSDQQIFGRNFDWSMDDALLMVNKRGCTKRSITRPKEKGKKATWIVEYGSITFNQYGRELPMGGMNEAGLVVEAMALSDARYPKPDHRPYLGNAMQWRQYLLDTCATVAEVIAADNKVRISDKAPGLGIHVLVLDKNGDAAVIEFLNGHMKVHSGDELPVAVSTNDTYAKSLQCLRKNRPPLFDQGKSISRFIKAAKMTQDNRAETTDELVTFAFDTLAAVSSERTQWRIVYDNKNMMVHFRTRTNPKIRRVNVSEFDFSRATPVKILDVNANLTGDVTNKFSAYTYVANRDQISRAYKSYGLPDKQLDALAKFPETFECR